jgi:hypothetical protein
LIITIRAKKNSKLLLIRRRDDKIEEINLVNKMMRDYNRRREVTQENSQELILIEHQLIDQTLQNLPYLQAIALLMAQAHRKNLQG